MGENNTKPTIWTKRLSAFLIDLLFVNVIFLLFKSFLGIEKEGNQILLALFVIFIYYTTFEYFFYNTIGKGILGLTILSTKTNTQNASLNQIFFRNLLRLIPLEHFTFISKYPKGFHDKYSETIVVENIKEQSKRQNRKAFEMLKQLDTNYLSSKKWNYLLKKKIVIIASVLSFIVLILLKNELFNSSNLAMSIIAALIVFIFIKIFFVLILISIWVIYQIFQFSINEKNYFLITAIFFIIALLSIKIENIINFPLFIGVIPFATILIIGKLIFPKNEKLNEILS